MKRNSEIGTMCDLTVFLVKTPYFLYHLILLFPQEPQPLGAFLDLYPEETTWT